MKKNEHLKQQIKTRYTNEDSEKLARELGITIQYLRVLAKRLHLKKGLRTVTNVVMDGKKLCPKCCKTLDIGDFNRDKYQPNNLDYWCRSCRHKSKLKTEINNSLPTVQKSNSEHKNTGMGFGIKKTHNPIIKVLDGNGNLVDGLRCKGTFCNNSEKPLSEFHRDKNNPSGHKNICKFCISERKKCKLRTLS